MKQPIKQKKCCYMDRTCTPECVAYSKASELSNGAVEMGMDDMHCVRLLLDLADLMSTMPMEDFEDENSF